MQLSRADNKPDDCHVQTVGTAFRIRAALLSPHDRLITTNALPSRVACLLPFRLLDVASMDDTTDINGTYCER